MMKFQIGEDVLKKTRCKKDFSCLSGKRHDLCKIEDCVSGKVYFLEAHNDDFCPCLGCFGSSHYCTCPTRIEIYEKYKV
jgi:hypothetical protein